MKARPKLFTFKKEKRAHTELTRATNPELEGLDDYEIIKQIGKGAFATVYQAHQRGKSEGYDVAVRIATLEQSRIWDDRILSIQELQELLTWAEHRVESMKSPAKLRFLTFRMTQEHLVTFSELCGDLFGRITSSPEQKLSESDARKAAYSIAECVAEAHALGTIHRDLKPENILIRQENGPIEDCVVADWASCVPWTTPGALHYSAAGSPGYVAPELLLGVGYSFAIDAWSFGIVVYEMLTGRTPLLSSTPKDIARETIEKVLPFPPKYWDPISPEAKDFVQRLLVKDPAQRMSMQEALQHPWLRSSHLAAQRQSLLRSYSNDSPLPTLPTTRRIGTQQSLVPALGMITGGTLRHPDATETDTTSILQGRVTSQHTSILAEISSGSSTAGSHGH